VLAEAGLTAEATRDFVVVESTVTNALADTNTELVIRGLRLRR
jgi:hypothetical protein